MQQTFCGGLALLQRMQRTEAFNESDISIDSLAARKIHRSFATIQYETNLRVCGRHVLYRI